MLNRTLQIITQISVHCEGDTQGLQNTLGGIVEW